jgi:hypothetical protein
MGVSGQHHAPAALYPRYPLYRRLGGTQSRSGYRSYRKNPLPPPGIEPRSPGRPARSQTLDIGISEALHQVRILQGKHCLCRLYFYCVMEERRRILAATCSIIVPLATKKLDQRNAQRLLCGDRGHFKSRKKYKYIGLKVCCYVSECFLRPSVFELWRQCTKLTIKTMFMINVI